MTNIIKRISQLSLQRKELCKCTWRVIWCAPSCCFKRKRPRARNLNVAQSLSAPARRRIVVAVFCKIISAPFWRGIPKNDQKMYILISNNFYYRSNNRPSIFFNLKHDLVFNVVIYSDNLFKCKLNFHGRGKAARLSIYHQPWIFKSWEGEGTGEG